ncbi:hypothetical protein XAUB_40060 [Xanthomonas citri pv. aurantifolii str. ICPB 11122]|nr:hypothetical protein XAUB_40060 [Xanthomonas citri pv. aurantifolii str. ICPB 11122]
MYKSAPITSVPRCSAICDPLGPDCGTDIGAMRLSTAIKGGKPEPPKFPSPQLQSGHECIHVEHPALPGCWFCLGIPLSNHQKPVLCCQSCDPKQTGSPNRP